jgi:hypothetical protein
MGIDAPPVLPVQPLSVMVVMPVKFPVNCVHLIFRPAALAGPTKEVPSVAAPATATALSALMVRKRSKLIPPL